MKDWLLSIYNLVYACMVGLVAYFLPIHDLILFITVLFITDVIVGYLKSRKFGNKRFETGIIWRKTMPRWLFSVVILCLLFAWDNVHHQTMVNTYYVGGYFISGTIIASILDNALKITNWKVFKGLKEKINIKTQY